MTSDHDWLVRFPNCYFAQTSKLMLVHLRNASVMPSIQGVQDHLSDTEFDSGGGK
jgi:hypothetical protein